MYVYIYIYICVYTYIYIYIYIHRSLQKAAGPRLPRRDALPALRPRAGRASYQYTNDNMLYCFP